MADQSDRRTRSPHPAAPCRLGVPCEPKHAPMHGASTVPRPRHHRAKALRGGGRDGREGCCQEATSEAAGDQLCRPCLVGMEACATAHYWARELTRLGPRGSRTASPGSNFTLVSLVVQGCC